MRQSLLLLAVLLAATPPSFSASDQALRPSEKTWLTFEELKDYQIRDSHMPGDGVLNARAQVRANLRAADRERYDEMIAAPIKAAELDALLNGIAIYGSKDPDETALNGKELEALKNVVTDGKNQAEAYQTARDAVKPEDRVKLHQITDAYRKMIPPGAKPAAAPLTEEERKKLNEEQKAAYDKKVKEAGDNPEKLAAVYGDYRKLDSPSPIEPPKTDSLLSLSKTEYDKLTPEKKADFCKGHEEEVRNGSKRDLADMKVREACEPEAVAKKVAACKKAALAAPDAQKNETLEGKKMDPEAIEKNCADQAAKDCEAAQQAAAQAGETMDKDVKAACLALLENARNPGGKYNITGPKKEEPANPAAGGPGMKEGTDAGGKTEAEPDDPNKWLHVKTGAVGSILGVLVGSFFGPVGIVLGAAIAFGVFWGVSKLTN